MKNLKLSLSRHETFPLRNGWAEKALFSFSEDEEKVFSKEYGSRILGVGSNMVKAIKFWMVGGNIFKKGRKLELSEFGRSVIKYDPYFESKFTWLIFHYFLVTDFAYNPVFYSMFHSHRSSLITERDLVNKLSEEYEFNGYLFNQKLLEKDVRMFINTYLDAADSTMPEDNFSSPLAKLGFLSKSREKNVFEFKLIDYFPGLELVVYLILENCFDESFEINSVYSADLSPLGSLRISNATFQYCITQLDNLGLLNVNRTANLDVAYIVEKLNIDELYSLWRDRR